MVDPVRLGTPDTANGVDAAAELIGGVYYQLVKTLSATSVTMVDASAGATFAALAAGDCKSVYVENNRSGAVDIEVRRGGAGGTRVVPAGAWGMFDGLTDASGLQIKRLDGGAVAVTVSTELRA